MYVGECAKNPNYMLQSCKKSCYTVDPSFYARKAKADEKESQRKFVFNNLYDFDRGAESFLI